jgi:hypothetical protein
MTEKNLDTEDAMDEARGEARGEAPVPEQVPTKDGTVKLNDGNGPVVVNPDLVIPPRPDWFVWRAELARNAPWI